MVELYEALVKDVERALPRVPSAEALAQLPEEVLGTVANELLICALRADVYASCYRARDMVANMVSGVCFALSAGLSLGHLTIPAALALVPGSLAMGWHMRHRAVRTRPIERLADEIHEIGRPVFAECRRRGAARGG